MQPEIKTITYCWDIYDYIIKLSVIRFFMKIMRIEQRHKGLPIANFDNDDHIECSLFWISLNNRLSYRIKKSVSQRMMLLSDVLLFTDCAMIYCKLCHGRLIFGTVQFIPNSYCSNYSVSNCNINYSLWWILPSCRRCF